MIHTKRILLSVLCLCALVFYTRAEGWTHETVPSPKVYGQDYYVSNPDTVLSFETVDELNELCTRLNANTGVELAVVAIDEFDENRYTAYDFALDLFNYWGIGSADRNTGVLIFLARGNRDIQIITGKGIEGILTDGKCGELLDDNLSYFANDDFDNGMLALCKDMEEYLMQDNNRSELMLGWVPEDTILTDTLLTWIFFGFIIMVLMAWLGYKRLQGQPGQPEENILKGASDAQMGMGCLSFFFPIPMLFFYLFYRFFPKHPQTLPMKCKKCGTMMESVPMDLSKTQLKEQELHVFAFAKWHCPNCGEEESVKCDGRNKYKYHKCPSCGGQTSEVTETTTLRFATEFNEGLRRDTYTCHCCGAVRQEKVRLPRKRILLGGSSGGSGGSGGSGSWGGGSSSGGGAGRSF